MYSTFKLGHELCYKERTNDVEFTETGTYYNGLRTVDEDALAVVDVVEDGRRSPLTLWDGRASFGWFDLDHPSELLAEAILYNTEGEEGAKYRSEFSSKVVMHLHGEVDYRPSNSGSVVERQDGTICAEQWRLPQEKVRLWLLERAERGPLSAEEQQELDFSRPDKWMIEGTWVDV